MTDPTAAFTKFVPGFDFLQGLVKNAGAALPKVGQWIAPTLNPEELEKRIEELRTVQFWLEQNARMLGATIQALEVQRMTLSTLKTMNVSLGDLTESLKIRLPEPPAEPPAPAATAPAQAATAPRRRATKKSTASTATSTIPPGVVDPMQWWGALTQQFTELAAGAMKEGASEAARNLAGSMVKQGIDAAGQTMKKAASVPMGMARTAASAAQSVAKSVTQSGSHSAAGKAAAAGSAQPKAAHRRAATRR